jgi:hypothetical protein
LASTVAISAASSSTGSTELTGAPVLFTERFEFDAKRQRLLEIIAEHQHAVIAEQAGAPIGDRSQHCVGQSLCAKSRVVGTAQVVAAEARDHVVKGRDVAA